MASPVLNLWIGDASASPQAPELRTTEALRAVHCGGPFGIPAAAGGLDGGLRVIRGLSWLCRYDDESILPDSKRSGLTI